MKKKGLVYLLSAAMMIGAAGLSGGETVRADEIYVDVETEASETDAEAAETDAETSEMDAEAAEAEASESDAEEDSEDRAATGWIKDWDYEIKDNVLTLKQYKGPFQDVVIKKTAKVNGKTYNVNLYGSWAFAGSEIDTLSFEKGFKLPADCSCMFYGCTAHHVDLTGVDASKVTDMESMFAGEFSLIETVDGGDIDVSKVTTMKGMFAYNLSVKKVNLSGWKTDSLTNMRTMFWFCESLESVDLTGFNTSNVTDAGGMFACCSSLKSLDLSSFDMSRVVKNGTEDYDLNSFFSECDSLEQIYTPKNFTEKVSLPHYMYDPKGCLFARLPENVSNTKRLVRNFTGWTKNFDNEYVFMKDSGKYITENTILGKGYINNLSNWYAATNGLYDTSFTGLAKFYGKSGWGFAREGILDASYSGLALATNGHWYYVNKGIMDKTFDGKLAQTTEGKWYYVRKGSPTKSFTEKIAETTDGRWFYCTDGRPDLKFSGKVAYCTNGNWYYVTKGKIDRTFTGIAEATNGKKYYVVKGVLNKNFTGTVTYEGETYVIVNGAVKN